MDLEWGRQPGTLERSLNVVSLLWEATGSLKHESDIIRFMLLKDQASSWVPPAHSLLNLPGLSLLLAQSGCSKYILNEWIP
jgi:hypothetical protein